MSTEWRFEVGGIYQHVESKRRVLVLHEGEAPWPSASYRHVAAVPLESGTDIVNEVFLNWNYPITECERVWKLVSRVAVNPRTSEV